MVLSIYVCILAWLFANFVLFVSGDHVGPGRAPFRILFTNAFLMFYYMEAKVVLQIQRSVLLERRLNILLVVVSSFHINSCFAT